MTTILLTTHINAPIDICFDLARDIDVHQLTTSQTKEKAIAGKTAGLCEEGDVIVWEATHLGIKQKLTSRITKMDKPNCFEDKMEKGAFAFMKHIHTFKEESGQTLMIDEFSFAAPFGFFGVIAEKILLKNYLSKFLQLRNRQLKAMAELNTQNSIP